MPSTHSSLQYHLVFSTRTELQPLAANGSHGCMNISAESFAAWTAFLSSSVASKIMFTCS